MRVGLYKNFSEKFNLKETDMPKYIAMIEERLKKHQWVSGEEIGLMDVTLYGCCSVFSRKPVMPLFQSEVLDKSPLISHWFMKMLNIVGEVE